ncbi:MAG: anaerobic ribonucleoside-triphosphate reductase, partial [Acutalibacteraceae bacterium]
MIKTIVKRDGREVNFSIDKIANAVYMAAQATGGKDYAVSLDIANQVVDYIESQGIEKPSVEEIQDAVEKILIENGHARTAKVYILYRSERSKVRDMNTRLMKIYEGLTFVDAKENDIKRENANIDGDTSMGTMLKYGSEGAKQFNELYVLKPEHTKAHQDGDIHIHDLDFLTLTTTCCQIDIVKLFKDGFSTGHGFLREPNDIASYSALACIAIQSNQNDQHGGQSIPNFDFGMAAGVAKTYRKIYVSNLSKALELICNFDDALEATKNLCLEVEAVHGVSP